MRLIDADELKSLLIETLENIAKKPAMDGQEMHIIAGCHMLCEMIDDAEPVDAEPVRHASLKETGFDEAWCNWGYCTKCGTSNMFGSKYCNECGAKMDGGKQDAEP